jgi:hypothetical protein
MQMKNFIYSILIILFSSFIYSFSNNDDQDLSKCLVKYRGEMGKPCTQCPESFGTYRAYFRNDCKQPLDVKVAAQEKDKRWRTFIRLSMQPGDSIVAYACKGTGKHMNWAKAAGDNSVIFPTDEEINKAYGN